MSYKNNEDSVDVFVVSDSINPINTQLNMRLIDFKGTELKQWNKSVAITANSNESHLKLIKTTFSKECDSNKTLLYTELVSDKKVLSENILYFIPNKDLALSKPKISYSVQEHKNQFGVELTTDSLAKNVLLSTNSTHNFSDNYFDMLPNNKKTIHIKKGASDDLDVFKENLKITTITNTYFLNKGELCLLII